jgi:predicted nucleic acid-binding protein
VIAVDTNVILHRLLQDDPAQSARVDALFEKETLILVTDVVLAEVAWILAGKRYAASAYAIAASPRLNMCGRVVLMLICASLIA